jgi:hypothetical protein
MVLGLTVSAADSTALAWPKVERDTKPWTRWWWLGSIGDEKSLTAEMEKYAAAGLGGLEITPIYGVRGYEDRFVPFLSPTWMRNFEHVLAEGRRLNLGIDLATGTGWPFGGPWLRDSDAAQYLTHRTYSVDAGTRLTQPVVATAKPVLRFAGSRKVPLAELREPVTANPNLQDLAIDQVRFEKPLQLVCLMGFPERGEPIELTNKVSSDGKLDWTAPADSGSWKLYAAFQGLHGKMVERAGPGGEGYALDHLSSSALEHYLAKFNETFAGHATSGLRAFFNDSYEVDDAEGEADFTPRFFAEFERRRGYDLKKRLSDLWSTTETEASSRVLSDYRETISDLILDEFTIPWRKWANAQGAKVRNQPHGSPANVLDLYAASDIPEQEGNGLLAMKLASSAAHLTGKPLTSGETATWLNEHFLSTLAELKATLDTFLLGRINHNCYHGTPFSPPDDPWPGFQFYASVELSPTNPLWHDFPLVNAYVTRAQSFLQAGEPDEDVLLYYNIHDRWAQRGTGAMPHFGHGRDPVGVSAGDVAGALREAGYGFDYVSDRLLEGVRFENGSLASAKSRYAAIVVPETKFMPESTLARLVELASNGATVLVLRQLPQSTPGAQPASERFASLLNRIQANATLTRDQTTATIGRGRIVIASDFARLMASHSALRPESLVTHQIEYVRRRYQDGHVYFLVNRGSKAIDGWVPLQARGRSATLYHPMTGQSGLAAFQSAPDQTSQVYLQLAPNESCIVQLNTTELAGAPAWKYWTSAGANEPLQGEWEIEFTSGGPALPPAQRVSILKSWTEFEAESFKAFSGTATYSLSFRRPTLNAEAFQLDLGNVADSARAALNGRELAGLVQAPWRLIIPASALGDDNELVVTVTNLAANRIADLDRRGVPWKKFYNVNMPARLRENAGPDGLFTAARWSPRASGLLGPVTLTPMRAITPTPAR